ncbi:MAG: purine-binding chemotaxis protein CheW [Leptospiraceae bacterium]|nr:purine-binding chemotaxis protein CheW [Leptospiraceae bacterium]MCP5493006.1 purine-binding chemotaxis protein CheW [Leptospiraceae bacterium]
MLSENENQNIENQVVGDEYEDEMSNETQLVSFNLGKEEFGLDIMQIQEIITLPSVTKIPRAPGFIEGIIDLRDSVLPVVDLRKKLLLPPKEFDEETRVLVVTLKNFMIGLIVDFVTEVLRLQNEKIEATPNMISDVDTEYVKGISRIKRGLILILDVEKIFSSNEMHQMESVKK